MKATSGARDAPSLWVQDYAKKLTSERFINGASTPCVFVHARPQLRLVVHGDGFICLGNSEGLNFAQQCVRRHYGIKIRDVLGPHAEDDEEIRILNRLLTWSPSGLHYEADPRHVEHLTSALRLQDCRFTGVTGIKNRDLVSEDECEIEGRKSPRG